MNRRQRRGTRRIEAIPAAQVHAFADAYACPDCLADTELINPSPNVFVLEVRHDLSCPNYARMTATTDQETTP